MTNRASKVSFEPRRGAGGKRTTDFGDDALENERAKRRGRSQSFSKIAAAADATISTARSIFSAVLSALSQPFSDNSAVRRIVLKTDLQYPRLDRNRVAPSKRALESPSEYEYEDEDAVPDNCENEKKWMKVAFPLFWP
ncbi:hypothetical protein DL768_005045 [Monosporascus sp. mg162]|nr:hypothetical protein DL768_005045 [Monosporascus sp. mg162]